MVVIERHVLRQSFNHSGKTQQHLRQRTVIVLCYFWFCYGPYTYLGSVLELARLIEDDSTVNYSSGKFGNVRCHICSERILTRPSVWNRLLKLGRHCRGQRRSFGRHSRDREGCV